MPRETYMVLRINIEKLNELPVGQLRVAYIYIYMQTYNYDSGRMW